MATPTNTPPGEPELESVKPKSGQIHLLDPSKFNEKVEITIPEGWGIHQEWYRTPRELVIRATDKKAPLIIGGELIDRSIYIPRLEERGILTINSDVAIDGLNALKNFLVMETNFLPLSDDEKADDAYIAEKNALCNFFQKLLSGLIDRESGRKGSRMKKIKKKKKSKADALKRFNLIELARKELEKKEKEKEKERKRRCCT